MTNNPKTPLFVGIAGVILALVAIWHPWSYPVPAITQSFGGTPGTNTLLAENYIPYILYNQGYNSAKPIATTGTFTLGSSGTALNSIIVTSCSLISSAYTVTASSTLPMDCAVTGAVSTDKVFASFAEAKAYVLQRREDLRKDWEVQKTRLHGRTASGAM